MNIQLLSKLVNWTFHNYEVNIFSEYTITTDFM